MEKIKALLLSGIFCILLWLAFHPRPVVGRFVPRSDSDLMSPVLDTKTGTLCMPYKAKNMNLGDIPVCSELK